ncbi:MAG: hypothetical protein U9R44_04245 [Candidatus Omnitrophota bacterium]|nr:hypothetical protein [Candidatus Omnitrophota bacterium]
MKKLGLCMVMLILACAVCSAAIIEKEIVAEGMAAGDTTQAREVAVNRALRKAVEQGVGVIVDSETIVKNFQLLDDQIYSTVKGYVTSYEVIADNGGESGVYKVKVKAKVALGALTKDVKALGIVKKKLNYPRVMVLIDDYIDGLKQPRHIAAAEIEKMFIANKVPVTSKDQMERIKARDATLSYGNPEKAAALGRRYGAEVVVIGLAASELIDSSQPYGVSVYAYQATVDTKAVKTDNAHVMAIDSAMATARGSGRMPAANKALLAASQGAAKSLIKRIAEVWRDEVYNETVIQIICENADPDSAVLLKNAIEIIDGVKEVNEKSVVNNVAEMSVRFFGSMDQFVAGLSGIKEPGIEITGKTSNRVDIKILMHL